MTVTIEDAENGEQFVHYGAKRPLKFTPYNVDCVEAKEFFECILEYVAARANGAEHLRKMTAVNMFKLIERFSTEICYAESPKQRYGISKAEIRSAVRYALDELMQGNRVFVGPSVEGADVEFVEVVRGKVSDRKPSFAR
jgi:hypothetical protein